MMTTDQRELIQKWIAHCYDFSKTARLPVSSLAEAIEACLLECDRLRDQEHKRHWGQWEAAYAWKLDQERLAAELRKADARVAYATDIKERAAKLAEANASTLPECAGNEWDAACRAIAKDIREMP